MIVYNATTRKFEVLVELDKSSGGGGGGGSTKFPTIVTDSGSSLPSASGYQEGDTFLDTTDKKIYKMNEDITGYTINGAYTIGTATVDLTTGVVSNFGSTYNGGYIHKGTSYIQWKNDVEIKIHFKLNSAPADDEKYVILISYNGYLSYPYTTKGFGVYVSNKKLYFCLIEKYVPSSTIDLFDFELNTNTEYYLKITKTGTSMSANLSTEGYDETTVATHTSTTEDYYESSIDSQIFEYGEGGIKIDGNYQKGFSIGQIYLGDSSGEMVTATIVKDWDNGTDLTDKTEYVDKTNGALYLYENSELVKIGGSLTKKVYTISADNTSTLNVSSDFTKVVDVLKNGVELALTDDYTISNGVITFVTALSTIDKIIVKGE